MIHERCNRLSTGFRDKLSAGLPNDKRGNVMRWAFLLASIMTISLPAMASPWIEPGDAQVREDVERLQAARIINGPINAWPLPWATLTDLAAAAEDSQFPPDQIGRAHV